MPGPSILRRGLLAALLLAFAARPGLAADEPVAHAPADVHAAGSAEAGHGEGGQPNILEFKPSLAITTVIVFLCLMAVLWKYAWGPLSESLTERERKQDEIVRLADEAKAESARLLIEHKRQMDEVAERARQILEEAKRQADLNAQTIVQSAQQEAESSRERAQREIGVAKDQALNEIWTKTADLAVSVAGKVLSKELSQDDHRRLVDAAVGELPAGSANGNGGGRA